MIAGSSKWCIWFPQPCLTPSHPIPSLPCSHSEVQGDFILTWLHLQRSHCQGHILKFWVSINLGGGDPAQSPLSFYIYWVPVLLQPHLMPTFPRGFILFLKHVMALSTLALAHLGCVILRRKRTLRRSLSCMLFLSVYCLLDISSANIFLGQVIPFYALLEPISLPLWHLLSL